MASGDGEVVFDNAEIQRILNGPEMQAEVRMVCNAIMARARVNSPVLTGSYVNSFSVVLMRSKKLRVVGFVVNTDPKAAVIESIHGPLIKSRRAR